jgi:hypothetical protein
MLYVKIIGGHHCVISATLFVEAIPAFWQTLQSKSSGSMSHTKETTSGCAIQWKRARVLHIHTWRSDHRHFPLDNTMTMPHLPTTTKPMYWTVFSADSFIQQTTIATCGKITEELPIHVANTLQMTESTIRHRLKNLKIRMNTTTCILKAATVPVFMLWM